MKLYLDNGYLNIPGVLENEYTFNIIVGGRGTGKTYGALKYVKENNIKFMFSRRTQEQVNLIKQPVFNPYKVLNNDMHWNVQVSPIGPKVYGFYDSFRDIDSGEYHMDNVPFGIIAAVSTFSNMRGFDASDVKVWLYDEFIKESKDKPIKEEGKAILNMYESMNRNRELKGEPPIKFLAMANSEDIANPLMIELGLVTVATRMQKNHQEQYFDKERSIALYLPQRSPISQQKAETALYKLTKYSQFNKMALDNEFVDVDLTLVRSAKLSEYRPLVRVGEITVYQHKAGNQYYVTDHHSGQCQTYTSGATDLKRFLRSYSWLWNAYLNGRVYFEEYLFQVLLEKYFGM